MDVVLVTQPTARYPDPHQSQTAGNVEQAVRGLPVQVHLIANRREDVLVTNSDPASLPKLRPLYVVAFEATPSVIPGSESWPVFPLLPGVDVGTVPHGLDRDLLEVMPALWYCLQLPRTVLDVTDWLSAAALGLSHWMGAVHAILLVPADLVHSVAQDGLLVEPSEPALVFCPDRLVDQLTPAVAAAGFPVPPVPVSSLSDGMFGLHSQQVADVYGVPPRMMCRPRWSGGSTFRAEHPSQAAAALARDQRGEITSPDELAEASFDVWFRRAHAEVDTSIRQRLRVLGSCLRRAVSGTCVRRRASRCQLLASPGLVSAVSAAHWRRDVVVRCAWRDRSHNFRGLCEPTWGLTCSG